MNLKLFSFRKPLTFFPIISFLAGGVFLILRFYLAFALPIHPDEAYYRLWSIHLDWSYVDHPGGVAWLIWLGRLLLGDGLLAIRLPGVFLVGSSVVLFYLVAAKFSRKEIAFYTTGLFAVGNGFFWSMLYVRPNVLFIFALLLFLWSIRQAHERPLFLLPAALGSALLVNAKFTGLLILPLWIYLASRFYHRAPWLVRGSLFILLLGLLPVLGWNVAHGFPGIHLHSQRLTFTPFPWPAVKGLLVYFGPFTLLFILVGIGCHTAAEKLMLVAAFVLMVPFLFGGVNMPRNMSEGMLLLLLAAVVGWSRRNNSTKWQLALVLLFIGAAGWTGYHLQRNLTDKENLIFRLSEKEQFLNTLNAGNGRMPIIAVDYELAGILAFYLNSPVYTHWGNYLYWDKPSGDSLLVVTSSRLPITRVEATLRSSFRQVSEAVRTPLFIWHPGNRLIVWKVKYPRAPLERILPVLDQRRFEKEVPVR